MWTVPNILTLGRIGMVPLLVGAFFLPGAAGWWVPLAIFLVAAVTDFLDGHLARSLGQVTAFGRFLDPVADKLLVAATLVAAIAFDRLGPWGVIAALLILCREFVISALREFLAADRVVVPVSALAKWKTAVQMIALSVVIVAPGLPVAWAPAAIGEGLLWLATVLTLVSGWAYLRAGLRHIRAADTPADGARRERGNEGRSEDDAGGVGGRRLKRSP